MSPGRKRMSATLLVLGVVVVLLGVLSGFIYQQQHQYDVTEQRRQTVLQVAKQHAVALLSYNYKTVEQELRRERKFLTGQFKKNYTTLVRQFVAPAAKKQKLNTRAEIAGAAVLSVRSERAQVLLFVNQRVSSKGSQPQRAGSRVRMTLQQVDGEWLVSQLQPI